MRDASAIFEMTQSKKPLFDREKLSTWLDSLNVYEAREAAKQFASMLFEQLEGQIDILNEFMPSTKDGQILALDIVKKILANVEKGRAADTLDVTSRDKKEGEPR